MAVVFQFTCLFSAIPEDITLAVMFNTNGANSFTNPVWFGEIPSAAGAYLVLEQVSGNIYLLENNGANTTKSQYYHVDVRSEIHEGLLSLAFHPDFAANRKYYICYSPQLGASRSVVEQRTASEDYKSDSGEPGLEIFTLEQPASRHNLGNIMFGPDGFLYIGSGNGGIDDDINTNGQDISNVYAAILRIDVDNPAGGNAYGIPADNPFAGGGGAAEIFANGLRNPWRFSFDPLNGNLWVGDVGSNIAEEISIVGLGNNMGWKTKEGNNCRTIGCSDAGLTPPIWSYVRTGIASNAQEAKSIMGGYVFRANQSSEYYGVYVFTCNRTGGFWGLRQEGGVMTESQKWPNLSGVASFGRDVAGNIYAISRTTGTISKLEMGEPDEVPVQPITGKNSHNGFDVLPFSQQTLRMFFKNQGSNVVTINNILGKTVLHKTWLGGGEVSLDLKDFKSGLYFIQLTSEGEQFHKKFNLIP